MSAGQTSKSLPAGQKERLRFPSGRDLTPDKVVAEVKKLAANWQYDAVSIGVPGPFLLGQLIAIRKTLDRAGSTTISAPLSVCL